MASLLNSDLLQNQAFATLRQVQTDVQRHHRQIRYQHFEQRRFPLGREW